MLFMLDLFMLCMLPKYWYLFFNEPYKTLCKQYKVPLSVGPQEA